MRTLYQGVVLDHYRRPRHSGALPGATHAGGGHNPSCGDRLQLTLRVRGEVIEDVGFTAQGCAISVASASLMSTLLPGKTVAQALALADRFSAMLQSGDPDPALGDSAVLSGVHALPARVKCAALGWQTLRVMLERPPGG
nr:SUF system NifU family Fe-S cluster assembly protein [Deinococcus budaensis]